MDSSTPNPSPESGGCQQLGRPAVVVHVGHGAGGVLHLIVHDGVDEDGHAVFGQDLQEDISSERL